ncbi:MAG: L-cystine transporter [Staphylococcus rostri]|uniref:L-cystine transporter n=1 Tax=Staphylococcus rostri TaxID=522262 RepID=UPI0026DFEB1A|nr:L-cystine transporter [Staphylococcus rostri]MDO5375774.1 L-cystine transporter [Staphylococcus rostri]
MSTLLIILNLIIFIAILAGLWMMTKKHVKFPTRVFTALGLGIVLGVIVQLIYGSDSKITTQTTEWIGIIGNGYISLLQMIVIPLVFVSIIAAFTKIDLGEKFAKMGSYIFMFLIGTVAIAAIVGIAYAMLFGLDASSIDLGQAENARSSEITQTAKDLTATTLPAQILELLPANPFLDFTGARATSTIAVVIFAAFIGFAYLRVARKQPENGHVLKRAIDAVYALVMAIVTFVLRLTPYGILAIMLNTMATSDFAAIWTLGKFVIASYAALITMYIIHMIILAVLGVNPIQYMKKTAEVMVFAFTSRSSAGTLPLNIQAQTNRLGVPQAIANFSGSFGLSIGQNGCAGIYPAMLAIMVAPVAGVEVDLQFIATLVLVVIISSFGVAGVGGGATFASILVLSALNLPVGLAGVLISVEPLIDMGRTALNVNDSMLAGTGTAKLTKQLDEKVFNDSHYDELSTSH